MASTFPESSAPAGIQFENVDKRYGGLYALRRVSLQIAPGECVVLAGRNGSGKTTLLRIGTRLVRPSAGHVHFAATNASAEFRPVAGYVAHATMVYDGLTAEENLVLFGRLQGIPALTARVETLLKDVGLWERRASLVRTFSRGMRQRIAIARALLHSPGILFLDEPATGLDAQGVAWLAKTLRDLREAGCTMLLSLHGESEISALATRGIRLDAGAVVADTKTGANFSSILQAGDA